MNNETRGLGLAPATANDYRELARRRLPRHLFDYLDGAAYEEITAGDNQRAFQRLRLRQRVMRDVSCRNLSSRVLGQEFAMPLILAPLGLAGVMARRAEVAAARAAEGAGIAFCESTVSICSIEEVRAATQAPFWYQLYVMRDRGYAKDLLVRAQAAGCPVLVLTVDLAVMGARYRDIRNGMAGALPLAGRLSKAWDLLSHPHWLLDVAIKGKPLTFGNLTAAVPDAQSLPAFKAWVDSQFDPRVGWRDLEWVRENWPGKILLKGILDVDDAREAAAAGVDGIVVSNHGGRQLDSVAASADALPRIVDAVGNKLEVLMDGGVRSGLDVVKALALGAKACLLGRAWGYAVAARGEAGIAHMLSVMRQEINVAMALSGTTDLQSLGRDALLAADDHPESN
ncbi:MAG: alpha-hydroxy-acid oxidizing enzyme [Rhodocyclales bacterium RIFCSPLOWO2_02_FULL_63_24]|nr:MAG: alpha-hydroxy-acid oxidizing enzyme [Rhodocyclales bacterium GWA2_65_19]OHC70385.1 MAG: alpha-hydroxy-acid oxidizing enzyme [Rhodocyclales bacterium RIFCSPLOWO2_02_FULL_63_24]